MRSVLAYSKIVLVGILYLSANFAYGTDLRFDVSTNDNAVLLPNLAFPSANGHIDLLGSSTYQSTLTASGNTLGIYYDTFGNEDGQGFAFNNYPDPEAMAQHIQQLENKNFSTAQNGWIALNEVSASAWPTDPVNTYDNGTKSIDYHTWCIDVVEILKNGDGGSVPAHAGVLLMAPFGTPGTSNASSWQAIAKYAYIVDERYIDGPEVQADGYSVSALQSYYQTSYNDWVHNAGVPPSRLIANDEFGLSTDSGFGASGLSGTAWQEAIEARDLAIYNVGFAGFYGYDWGKNVQGADDATRISYEKAYASTLVVQTEVPCWTGNDSSVTGDSWADYLNWTGGLPSTVNAPYPLLATANPNLSKQTAANFLSNANLSAGGTTVTLDGSQSITTMTFDSASSYTIAPGTGGSLTLTGANPSITVTSGSHYITAGVALNNNFSANLTGNLTLSGGFSTNGHTVTKSGPGTLTISGSQSHSVGSAINVTAGTLNLNTDAGSSGSPVLSLSASAGTINLNSQQHLASFTLNGGNASVQTDCNHILTNAFSISNGSTIDLWNNDMIVNYTGSSPLLMIRDALASGYNDGSWNGDGIVSSAAAGNPNHDTALAYDEASDLYGLVGSDTARVDGETIDATTIVIKYTWVGDLNMDGVVDATDLYWMSPVGTTNATWAMGDFNYDGIVNADDYALLQFGLAESGGQ
ncbi:MAG TPA: hypothetical protein VG722_10815, partial [Tepidisphaeraceae bacterium]|nr:hypothetical protein [Tepidisphaeraceae bacterium]